MSRRDLAVGGLGSAVTIGILSFLPDAGVALLGSMGASAALCWGIPSSPLASWRNALFSHPIAAASSLTVSNALAHPYSAAAVSDLFVLSTVTPHVVPALAVGAATVAMLASKTFHPPAGGTALIVATSTAGSLELLVASSAGAAVVAALSHAHKSMLVRRDK